MYRNSRLNLHAWGHHLRRECRYPRKFGHSYPNVENIWKRLKRKFRRQSGTVLLELCSFHTFVFDWINKFRDKSKFSALFLCVNDLYPLWLSLTWFVTRTSFLLYSGWYIKYTTNTRISNKIKKEEAKLCITGIQCSPDTDGLLDFALNSGPYLIIALILISDDRKSIVYFVHTSRLQHKTCTSPKEHKCNTNSVSNKFLG